MADVRGAASASGRDAGSREHQASLVAAAIGEALERMAPRRTVAAIAASSILACLQFEGRGRAVAGCSMEASAADAPSGASSRKRRRKKRRKKRDKSDVAAPDVVAPNKDDQVTEVSPHAGGQVIVEPAQVSSPAPLPPNSPVSTPRSEVSMGSGYSALGLQHMREPPNASIVPASPSPCSTDNPGSSARLSADAAAAVSPGGKPGKGKRRGGR